MEFASLKKENKKLQADVSTLTSQNTILDARVKELLAREDRLTQEINNLKLDNISLRKQVEVISDVPAQRDRLQLQLDTAQKKIAELEDQLEKAKKK
jgi:chromosome segregation ATPase